MLRFALVVLVVVIGRSSEAAGGYGSGSSSMKSMMGGYGSMKMMGGGGGGYGSSMMMKSGGDYGMGGMPVQAAIQSHHSVQYKDVPSTGSVKPTSIEIGAQSIPINFLFRSASSKLNVMQKHQSAMGSNQESQSEDQPHYLKHSVKKPVIQEIFETIFPMRKITQEVKPVEEMIETLIARKAKGGYGDMGGMGMMYGGGGRGMESDSPKY